MDPKPHTRVDVSLAEAPASPLVSILDSLRTDVEAIVKSITGVVTQHLRGEPECVGAKMFAPPSAIAIAVLARLRRTMAG